jgi:hypothetical protein
LVWSIAQRLAQDLSYGILPRNPAEKLGISHGRSSKDGYHIYRVPPTILNITLLGGAAAWPFAAHARQPNHEAPCWCSSFPDAEGDHGARLSE